MRLGNFWIRFLLCFVSASPRIALGQTAIATSAGGPTEGPAAAAAAVVPGASTGATQQPASEPVAPSPAGTQEERPGDPLGFSPTEPTPPPVVQPLQPGSGGQVAQPTPPVWGTEQAEGAFVSLPEDQLLGYWPVVAQVGAGYGLTAEGTVRAYNSAVTIEPSAFVGLLPLWGMFQGPMLALPFGLPGSYRKTVGGEDTTVEHGVSFAIVPGYRVLHPFRRDMFWAAGVGVPLLISEWQGSAPREYTFTPGVEFNAEYAYKFLAGLGVFARLAYQVYFGTYTLTTFGGSIGLLLYWEWFEKFRPSAPPADAHLGQGVQS